MNEQVKKLITGLGAVAEYSKVAYDAFLKAGFNRDQAIYLTGEMMKETLRMGGDKRQEEN